MADDIVTPTERSEPGRSGGRTGRVVALVVGCLLLLPALGALLGGSALALAYAFGRDDSGFFETSLDRVESSTVAVTAEDIDFASDPGTPGWVIDALDADVRLRVTNVDTEQPVFVGIARQEDLDRYLSGVAHDQVRELDGRRPVFRNRAGGSEVAAPTSETFWVASASGTGEQELVWPATEGRWAAIVMNADGSPGVAADVDVGVKAGFVLPLALILIGVGVVATAGAVALIVFGARGLGSTRREQAVLAPSALASQGSTLPPPGATPVAAAAVPSYPIRIEASLDPGLSRWQWLVKWFLAIPHFVILVFLWLAFVVLSVVAFFSILFTGRYPRGIFGFNVGVLRWTWRVSYYAWTGGIGTDRYPPFSLQTDPTYPATLDVEYPEHLSRGLVLVKWWLLAIPHYVIVGILEGGAFWATNDTYSVWLGTGGGGLLGVLVLVAAIILLFTNRYSRSLFDLIIGLNRWVFRVVAYAALMTDEYPPFRLDQGGTEPTRLAAAAGGDLYDG